MTLTGCPIPGATGFQKPSGTGSSGVLILGEAMGTEEAKESRGFVEWAQAGAVLTRAIKRAGLDREQFVFWNVVPTQPPNNWLEGAPWEHAAIEWGRPLLEGILQQYRPRCILALGNVATRATTGLAGAKLGVSYLSGFLLPSLYEGIPVVPCFHPSYLRQGAMSHLGILMRAIKLSVRVARERRQPLLPSIDSPPPGYILRPTEATALEFEREAEKARYIAFDIETPYSADESSAEEYDGLKRSVLSVQFSLGSRTGIFMPWREPFIPIAKRILANGRPKLSWNGWRFDEPVLAGHGAPVVGENHDLMWAWHHLQPDIPRGLQFASAQCDWPWPWKHLDNSNPQFYGIVDVDVLQYMVGN